VHKHVNKASRYMHA